MLSLRTHIYIITKTTRWEVVKYCASPKRPFVSCHFSHFQNFQSKSWANISLFHFFSLRPHPALIQKGGWRGGGHALHAYSFSYWDTPTSGPKGGGGGGMCLKCPTPRSTYYMILFFAVPTKCAFPLTYVDFVCLGV